MATTKWALDPTHAEVQFKVKHMMISTVTGHFTKFDATVETEDDDFSTAKASFTVETDSITTNNEQRDGHLKSPDFFDVAKFPQIRFVATKVGKVGSDGAFTVSGDLTIRDVTKPVTLDAEFGGIIKDPWGNIRAGVTVDGKINRKEFGLAFHAVTETGGLVLADEVKVTIGLEFVKQA